MWAASKLTGNVKAEMGFVSEGIPFEWALATPLFTETALKGLLGEWPLI